MTTRTSYLKSLLIAGLMTWSFSMHAQTVQRIAIVNSARILHETLTAKQAKVSLEKEFGARERDLASQAESIDKQIAQLKLDAPETNDQPQLQYEQKIRQLNGKAKDVQRQKWALMQARSAANLQFSEKVITLAKNAIQHVANEQRFDIVLTDALYVSPAFDITDKVIEYMDAESPSP